MDIKNIIESFLKDNKYMINVYNEFSLQHELGIYLSKKGYNVYFEKNVREYIYKDLKLNSNLKITEFINNNFQSNKREIDLVIIDNDKNKYAIELKFPRNGAYPEQMRKMLKDILFMQDVKRNLYFKKTYCLTLVDDEKFNEDIYDYKNFPYNIFRKNIFTKETIKEDDDKIYLKVLDKNISQIKWHKLNEKVSKIVENKDKTLSEVQKEISYYLIEIND